MSVKLIACDLDNTLTENAFIFPEIKDFLQKIVNRGIKFVINSGRCLEEIRRILLESKIHPSLGFPQVIISGQGVNIHYLKGKDYVADEEWNKEKEEQLKLMQREISWEGIKWEKLIKEMGLSPKEKRISYGLFALIFDKEKDARLARDILIRENHMKYVTFLRNKGYVTASLSTALKGKSLLRAAQHFNIPPSQVLAIGDSQNDEDMLNGKFGFLSAAPSNADEEIKEMVNRNGGYIALHPIGKGTVEAIRSFLLKNHTYFFL